MTSPRIATLAIALLFFVDLGCVVSRKQSLVPDLLPEVHVESGIVPDVLFVPVWSSQLARKNRYSLGLPVIAESSRQETPTKRSMGFDTIVGHVEKRTEILYGVYRLGPECDIAFLGNALRQGEHRWVEVREGTLGDAWISKLRELIREGEVNVCTAEGAVHPLYASGMDHSVGACCAQGSASDECPGTAMIRDGQVEQWEVLTNWLLAREFVCGQVGQWNDQYSKWPGRHEWFLRDRGVGEPDQGK